MSKSGKLKIHTAAEVRAVLGKESTLAEHLTLQTEAYGTYTSTLFLLLQQGAVLSHGTKARCLAVAWGRRDHELAQQMLAHADQWHLPEVVKACRLLDNRRRIKAAERRLRRLERQGSARKKTLGKAKAVLNDLKRDANKFSLSGALLRHVKRWVRGIPAERLEFFAMSMPKEPWCELADMVHLAPSDFQLDYFLGFVFGRAPPAGSRVAEVMEIHEGNALELITAHKLPYSFVRRQLKDVKLSAACREAVAAYESLDTVLWYWEELRTKRVDALLCERLRAGEVPQFGYGKLMERIMTIQGRSSAVAKALMPVAERALETYKLRLDPPVVVMGDASGSMQVAIRTSSVIAGLLAALADADLRFFNSEDWQVKAPTTVAEVLRVADEVRAGGCTTNAASLVPLFAPGARPVKYIMMITDEYENGSATVPAGRYKGRSGRFADLFKMYRETVSPDCKLVFVTFVTHSTQNTVGPMIRDLERVIPGIADEIIQFKMNTHKPDLQRVDALLARMAAESTHFEEMVASAQEKSEQLLVSAVERLTLEKELLELKDEAGNSPVTPKSASGSEESWSEVSSVSSERSWVDVGSQIFV